MLHLGGLLAEYCEPYMSSDLLTVHA
jgi:hypothetical protein